GGGRPCVELGAGHGAVGVGFFDLAVTGGAEGDVVRGQVAYRRGGLVGQPRRQPRQQDDQQGDEGDDGAHQREPPLGEAYVAKGDEHGPSFQGGARLLCFQIPPGKGVGTSGKWSASWTQKLRT